jgi:hypothetical protein
MKYSKAEMEMFAHYGMAEIAEYIQPALFYPMLACKAFTMNDTTDWAHGLRRCIKAMENGTVYRGTPEWDALIG